MSFGIERFLDRHYIRYSYSVNEALNDFSNSGVAVMSVDLSTIDIRNLLQYATNADFKIIFEDNDVLPLYLIELTFLLVSMHDHHEDLYEDLDDVINLEISNIRNNYSYSIVGILNRDAIITIVKGLIPHIDRMIDVGHYVLGYNAGMLWTVVFDYEY